MSFGIHHKHANGIAIHAYAFQFHPRNPENECSTTLGAYRLSHYLALRLLIQTFSDYKQLDSELPRPSGSTSTRLGPARQASVWGRRQVALAQNCHKHPRL
jgi:hypothetical protein